MLKDQLVSQEQATFRSWDRFVLNRNTDWGLHGHDMGVHQLNLMLGGWIPSKVTTIGARSGIGKTALTVPMFDAGRRVLNGKRAEFLFFSWEMESSYLVDRHICFKTDLTLRMLNQGAKLLSEKTMEGVKSAYSEARSLPVTYQQNSLNIKTVRAISMDFIKKCEEKSKLEGVTIQPVIVFDYIGLALFEGSGLRTYGIADFMNGVKQLVNDTGAAALVLAQINRGADEKDVPDRRDFSDSQSIEQASDNLVLLHRPEYNLVKTIFDPQSQMEIPSTNKMLIRVLKGRDYGTGDSIIDCNIKHFQFWDRDHDPKYEYWKLYSSKEFWLNHFRLNDVPKK